MNKELQNMSKKLSKVSELEAFDTLLSMEFYDFRIKMLAQKIKLENTKLKLKSALY